MADQDILLVEDESAQRRLVAGILSGDGYRITEAESVEAAYDWIKKKSFDLVISDWKMPGQSGFDLLKWLRENERDLAFIMVTAYGSIDRAVEAIRLGADDYLTKPFAREALLLSVERSFKARGLLHENRRLNEALSERDRLVDLVGRAPCMQKIYLRVQKISATDVTVMINGESGTGKELTARALHTLSHRADKPFIAVNCAAIPEGLLESEFFGAERGAYTGADKNRIGKFQAAHNGTLFLDEIGELPLSIQPKLLRAIQEGRFNQVGGVKETEVNVRIITATNRDLVREVAEGRFREDLFYRLNVVPIALPPLRERREDIPILVNQFIESLSRKHGTGITQMPARVLRHLVDYNWPGNVRELANVVERLVLLAEDDHIDADDLPPEVRGERNALNQSTFQLPPGGISWEDHERSCLHQAMEMAHGNRRRAARLLSLSYKTFLYRLEKYELDNIDSSNEP